MCSFWNWIFQQLFNLTCLMCEDITLPSFSPQFQTCWSDSLLVAVWKVWKLAVWKVWGWVKNVATERVHRPAPPLAACRCCCTSVRSKPPSFNLPLVFVLVQIGIFFNIWLKEWHLCLCWFAQLCECVLQTIELFSYLFLYLCWFRFVSEFWGCETFTLFVFRLQAQ